MGQIRVWVWMIRAALILLTSGLQVGLPERDIGRYSMTSSTRGSGDRGKVNPMASADPCERITDRPSFAR
jgi:hypothetical protein